MAATPKPVRKLEKKGVSEIKKSYASGKAGMGTENMSKKMISKAAIKHEKNLTSILNRKKK